MLDVPTSEVLEIELPPNIEKAFGIKPQKCFKGREDLMFVFMNQEEIQNLNPDFSFSAWGVTFYSVLHRNLFSIAVSILLLLSLYPVSYSLFLARFLSLGLWKPIARFSYSMYLFHILVVYLVAQNLHKVLADFDLSIYLIMGIDIFIVLIISIAISSITYYAVERPIMNLRKPTRYHP